MPDLTFELPHWAYWAGLVLFPLLAMVMARRSVTIGETERTLPIAYFVWLTGGILGFHRYYLRNVWGLLYLPLFIAILYANGQQSDAREVQSEQANIVRLAEGDIERADKALATADADLAALRAAVTEHEEGTARHRVATRKLDRAEKRLDDMRERKESAGIALVEAGPALEDATENRAFWGDMAKYAFFGIIGFMLIDALLMPWLAKRAREKAPQIDHSEENAKLAEHGIGQTHVDDDKYIGTGFSGLLNRISYYAGEYVSYWAVIAVFVYYFEVVSRYVFNSPTNWAHESMFLMFGMQYLIAGSYAMMTESHVRVDIFYAKFSARRKALVDILTSIFFFIFAGVLFVTSWIFASDASKILPNGEISTSEWAVAVWPIKWMMVVGATLLILQGVSKLLQDIRILATGDDGTATADMRGAA